MVNDSLAPEEEPFFQGKHVDEEFQFCFRQHWIRLVPSLFKLLGINAIIFAIGYGIFAEAQFMNPLTQRMLLFILAFVFAYSHLQFLACLYRYFLYVVVVTDKKIHRIKKTLLIIDDHQSVDLWMLQDIFKCQHGIIQALFGYGSIVLEAQETVLRCHFVPHITKKYEALMHVKEQARNRFAGSFSASTGQYVSNRPLVNQPPPAAPVLSQKAAVPTAQ